MHLLYHHAKYGEARSKNWWFLSVTLLNGRLCANNFAINAFEYGSAFDTTRQEKVCHCAPSFNLSPGHYHRTFKTKMR